MAEQFIKGLTFKSRAEFVEATYGPGSFSKIAGHLKGELRALASDTKNIKAASWYPFEMQNELDRAICKVLAAGDPNVFRRMGAFSAEFENRNIAIKQFTDPWRFLSLQASIWPRFFKPARADIVRVSDREARVHIHDFRSSHELCETNIGFFLRSMELCGAEDVSVVETQCSQNPNVEYCEYRIRWH
jgi:hypothetical protein